MSNPIELSNKIEYAYIKIERQLDLILAVHDDVNDYCPETIITGKQWYNYGCEKCEPHLQEIRDAMASFPAFIRGIINWGMRWEMFKDNVKHYTRYMFDKKYRAEEKN